MSLKSEALGVRMIVGGGYASLLTLHPLHRSEGAVL